MKVVLSTWGKFHFFDLARELHQAGVLARICTNIPRYRLQNENIPQHLIATNPLPAAFRYAAFKYNVKLPAAMDRPLARWIDAAQQGFVVGQVQDCDALVALSGAGLHGGRAVQARGGRFVCERSSTHIEWAKQIMEEEYRRFGEPPPYFEPRFVEKELAEYAESDAVVVPSRFVLRSFVERGVDPAKLVVNSFGVNLTTFRQEPARRSDGEFRVVWAGQIGLRKGIPYLLDAFRRLKHPHKRLLLAGGVMADLRCYLDSANLDGVEFLGVLSKDELRAAFNTADVFCIASIEEGMAKVTAEAMACGLPVVATENSGAEEIVQDGVEGFIVPARDPAAIADRLQRLADDADLRRTMGAAGLDKVRSVGGWRDYGQRYLQLLSRLTGKPVP
jgi:starch synthase